MLELCSHITLLSPSPVLSSANLLAMTITALRALHAVIGSAIDEIEEVYQSQSSNIGLSLDYPSLDVPFYSTRTNTPEVEKSEELRTEPTVFGAANKIVAACGQITATVHKPFFSLVECVNGVRVPCELCAVGVL